MIHKIQLLALKRNVAVVRVRTEPVSLAWNEAMVDRVLNYARTAYVQVGFTVLLTSNYAILPSVVMPRIMRASSKLKILEDLSFAFIRDDANRAR